jgi:hypothetical protein
MSNFLKGMNHARKVLKQSGTSSFAPKQLKRYSTRYDEIIAKGLEKNKHTKGRIAKREEKLC